MIKAPPHVPGAKKTAVTKKKQPQNNLTHGSYLGPFLKAKIQNPRAEKRRCRRIKEIGKLVEWTAGSCLSADNVNSPHRHLWPLCADDNDKGWEMTKDREVLSTWEFSLWLFFSLFGIFSFSWSRSSFSLCSWAISDSCSPSSSAHSTSVYSNQQNNCGICVFNAAQQSCWDINLNISEGDRTVG